MPTREVSRDNWVEFFGTFASTHNGQMVNLAVDGSHPDSAIMAIEGRELPLREIAADLKDGENGVVISVGVSSDKLLRHFIQSVAHVRVAQTQDGSDSTLTIEAVNGQTTTLDLDVSAVQKS